MNQDEKSRITREKVVTAIETILREQGSEALTIRNICTVSGVSYGSVYHHFGSKEELLYGFCRERLQSMLQANPLPEEINPQNIIHVVLWAYSVYAAFCEAMGKGVMADIYTHCEDDLFDELCYEKMVLQPILKAAEENFVQMIGNIPDMPKSRMLDNIHRDLTIQLKGGVIYWATVHDRHTEQGLQYLLEGPINRFLLSWVSSRYREEIMPLRELKLLSELSWYPGKIKIPFEPVR